MPANTYPIFSKASNNQWAASTITAANIAKDGTGTVTLVFTADATNGGFVQGIMFKALGTNVATVARIFLNNGLTNATAANNSLVADITLPATTLSEVAAQPDYFLPINRALDPGHKLNVTLGTAVAAGYAVTVWGGKY